MSGRTRWMRNGEVVTGYRKTERRQGPKRPLKDRLQEIALQGPTDQATRVRMAFILPASLQGFVGPGPHGGGLQVLAQGYVRITSWCAEKCFQRAQAFFRDIADGKAGFTLTAVLVSTKRPDERYFRHLTIVRGAVVVSVSSLVEPKVFEAA